MSALARAFFWQELMGSGRVKNMTELAKTEKIGLARMQKMLKLARLAPEIVEDIARGRQPVGLSLLFFVENPLPDGWNEQRAVSAGGLLDRESTFETPPLCVAGCKPPPGNPHGYRVSSLDRTR